MWCFVYTAYNIIFLLLLTQFLSISIKHEFTKSTFISNLRTCLASKIIEFLTKIEVPLPLFLVCNHKCVHNLLE